VYAGTTSAYANEKHVYYENIHAAATEFPKEVEKTTLHLGIVSGDWETIFAGKHYGSYEKGKDTAYVRTPERAGGPGSVSPDEKGLHIEVTYNIADRDFRVVAVDNDGKVHLSSRSGSGGTANLRRTTASFPALTGDRLQEFRFQVRPYEWAEFRDISLRPGKEALGLAEQQKAAKEKEIEKWLGQGQTRQIRQHILVLRVKDDELAKFMLDHQHRTPDESDRQAHAIIIACPVIEITKALEKITGHSEGPDRFSPEAAEAVKQRWQKWWDTKR
jgi:hypothetical protein